MTSAKRVGQIIGVLLLVQLATGLILPYVWLSPLSAPAGAFLDTAARMPDLVRLSVLLLFVGGAVSVGISVVAWPAVRERSYGLGLWLLALAVVNFTLQIVENAQWLSMLSVSQAYAEASATDAVLFPSLSVMVHSAFRWAHYSHILILVGWLFTLYWLLFRCAMIPRSLAVIGMVAAVLHFFGITLPAFAGYRMPSPELFGMPLGLANLMLAIWLMAKGVKESNATPDTEPHRAEVAAL